MMTIQQQLLQLVTQQFGLELVEQRSPLVVAHPQPVTADFLLQRLEGATDFIFPETNERTRAEMIVAPIVFHLAVACDLSLYCGNAFNADIRGGLSGTVDHLLSRAMPPRSTITPPIAAVVETKSRERGVSHCLVQMVAAQRVNACSDPVYGVVTNGLLWQFLKLEGSLVTIDLNQYPLFATQPTPSSLVPMDVEDSPAPIEPLLSLLLPLLKGSRTEDSPGLMNFNRNSNYVLLQPMNNDASLVSTETTLPQPQHLLIIDVETTGLNPEVDAVLELGAILYSIPYQTVVHQCSVLFNEEENPQAHLNHIPTGIVSEMTMTGDILSAFGKMLTGMMYEADYVVAHNAKFDRQWFDAANIMLVNEQKEPLPWLCTMSDFVFPKQSRSRLSLVNLCLDHRVSVCSAHRALTDCQLIAALFDCMESPQVLRQMVVEAAERASRPKYLYRALVSYQERQKAKDVGFQWDKERKMWVCELSEIDTQALPFEVVRLLQEGDNLPQVSAG